MSTSPPEIVSFSATPISGDPPLSVTFTCEATDLDGTITQYKWDFDGDGEIDKTTSTGDTTYTYENPSTYNATCTVVDDNGAESQSKALTITVKYFENLSLVDWMDDDGSESDSSNESSGGGGCSINPNANFDPGFLFILLVSGFRKLFRKKRKC
ncbi:MAG: PKD domain-containing protein [Desulfurobacteriaceae bacterium]